MVYEPLLPHEQAGVCSTMKTLAVALVAGIFLSITGTFVETCGVAEEGTNFTISQTCQSEDPQTLCSFAQQSGNALDYLTFCTETGCMTVYPDTYLINKTNDVYNFTVVNVSRVDLKPFIFINPGKPVWQCDLSVYAKPESPTCDTPSYSPGKNIKVKCSTPKSFPEAECAFKLQGQQTELPDVIYSHTDSSTGGVQYYNTTCELTYTVRGPGSYSFDMDMFVTINNTRYGTVSTDTRPLLLALPTVNSSLDCPKGDEVKDGYIKTGSTATCTCRRGDPGNPEGQVRWYDSSGLVVSIPDTDGGSSTLTLTQTDVDSYSCKADSDLGIQTQIMTYTPKFAFGPTLVNVNKGSNDPVDLCPASTHTVTVHCSVPVYNVNPYPVFAVYSDGQNVPTTRNNGTKNGQIYSYTDTVNVTTGGPHTLTCITQNARFDDMKTLNTSQIEVRVPPSSSPIIKLDIDGKSYGEFSSINLIAQENSTVSVTCQVDGGHPAVSSVDLTCGTNRSTTVGSQSVLTLLVSRGLDVLKCSCTAYHVTNCYVNNTSVITVTIHPPPASDKNISKPGDEVNIGAIAGGVTAGILFILVVVLVIYILRNKGILHPSEEQESKLAEMHTQPPERDNGPSPKYRNVLDNSKTYQPECPDSGTLSNSEYSVIRDGTIEYENTVNRL